MVKETEQMESEVKAVAVTENRTGAVMVGGNTFNVVQQVTVPILKHDSNETIAVRLEQPIVEEDQIEYTMDPKTGEVTDQKYKGKINVGRVTELGSNQLMQYVFNAISASELRAAYPGNGYVGKSFLIKKLGVVAGKRYKEVQIIEIAAG